MWSTRINILFVLFFSDDPFINVNLQKLYLKIQKNPYKNIYFYFSKDLLDNKHGFGIENPIF